MIYVVTDDGMLIAASVEYATAWRIAAQLFGEPAEHVRAVPLVMAGEVE